MAFRKSLHCSDAIYCTELGGHYIINAHAPDQVDWKYPPQRASIHYLFYDRGSQEWRQDRVHILIDVLSRLIAFADRNGMRVHDTYRDLLPDGDACRTKPIPGQIMLPAMPSFMDFRP